MTITIKFTDNIPHKYNSFEDILKLNDYNDIIYICGHNNNLSSLPELPNSLELLLCDHNNLSSLPKLPNSLTQLYCDYNCLSSLPELPNSLTNLNYIYNPIYIYISNNILIVTTKYIMNIKKILNGHFLIK